MSFFAIGATLWWTSSWGREGVSFPSAPALQEPGPVLQHRSTTSAVMIPNSATGIPDDFRVPASCGQCLCYCQNTAPSSFSPVTPGIQLQTRAKQCHREKREEKYFQLHLYLYTHTCIFLLIIRSSKLQINPEMQKYGLCYSDKTLTCFQCHGEGSDRGADSVIELV